MNREFLGGLGLENTVIDQIMAVAGQDIEREKTRANQAKQDLQTAQGTIAAMEADLENLRKNATDADGLQKQLSELQEKYNADTQQMQQQLQERDYMDAINAAISGANLKFSSKSAEKTFRADLKGQKFEVADGKLTGFDNFLNSYRENDPGTFVAEKQPPAFSRAVGGTGGANAEPETAAVAIARQIGAASAANNKTYNEVMGQYTGKKE